MTSLLEVLYIHPNLNKRFWLEELAQEGCIELEDFPVLEVKHINRGGQAKALLVDSTLRPMCYQQVDGEAKRVLEGAAQDWITSGRIGFHLKKKQAQCKR